MDPLSLTANVVAVASAALDVSKKLRRLISLRNAPQELLQFLNEISDIQVVLTIVGETSSNLETDNCSYMEIKNRLDELLRDATNTLNEFDSILRNKVGVRSDNSTTPTKFSWRAWVQNISRLRELLQALRTVRLDINHTLTMMTASEIPRLRIRLAEVTTQYSNTQTGMRRFEEKTSQQISAVISSVDRIHTGIAALNSESIIPQVTTRYISTQTSVFYGGQSSCSKACICRCHKFTKYKSADWLESLLGRLLIGYSGIPSRPSCNETRCRPNNSSLLTVNYYFPRWFLNKCLISFRGRWNPTEGSMISIRTPRILQSSTLPVFQMAQRGDTLGIQMLFGQGLASPFDTEPVLFDSLLAIAAAALQSETCAFLLSQCADPNVENFLGLSVIDRAWSATLSHSPSPEALSVKKTFERYFDVDDIIHRWGFTTLHRIILGLSPLNLRAQLETTTAEIDTQDAIIGNTPLQWSILRSDTEAMRTLIEFGASFHLQNKYGYFALYQAATSSTISTLKVLLGSMLSTSRQRQMPDLERATSISQEMVRKSAHAHFLRVFLEQQTGKAFTALSGCSFYNNRSECARLLLDSGANVDSNSSPIAPLLIGIQQRQHATVRLLLERGARLDFFDEEIQGTLHLVAQWGDVEMIQIIGSQKTKKLRDLETEHKDVFKRTALETFDVARPQYNPNEPSSQFQKCRVVFVALLNRIRHAAAGNPDILPRVEEVVSEESEDGEDVFYDVE